MRLDGFNRGRGYIALASEALAVAVKADEAERAKESE
jgi:hypothetical protein